MADTAHCKTWRKWTDDEDKLLMRHYKQLGPERCAKRLINRSTRSVSQRAHLLGLTRKPYGEPAIEQKLDPPEKAPIEEATIDNVHVARMRVQQAFQTLREAEQAYARATRDLSRLRSLRVLDVCHQRRVS